ncbi:MAG TPA: hypothetical protein VN285_01575 [Candidatus Deferrimicrobium sp.]|nr:hypothetical protein [Candidatus Deferrimicrobium sp.]
MKAITGNVLKLGDKVSSAQLLPERYHSLRTAAAQAKHVLEGCGISSAALHDHPVLVAGRGFGVGHDVPAVIEALKAAGVRCIMARSFGRDFFRTAINHGLPVVVSEIVDGVENGDNVSIDFENGTIIHAGTETKFTPYPDFVLSVIESGDLIAAARKELGRRSP